MLLKNAEKAFVLYTIMKDRYEVVKQSCKRCVKTLGCKGQLISEWLFDVFNFPKKPTLQFDEFLP